MRRRGDKEDDTGYGEQDGEEPLHERSPFENEFGLALLKCAGVRLGIQV